MPEKKYKKWRKLNAKECQKIVQAFNLGISRNEIKRLYKITDGQICRVIRDDAKKQI